MNIANSTKLSGPLSILLTGVSKSEPEIKHYFSEGVCIREATLLAGTFALGASHKHKHITIVSKGTVHIRIGNESKVIHAPCTFESEANTRKLAFAYTDCVISNVIVTDLTDIDEIEKQFTTLQEDKMKFNMKELQWLE